MKSKKFIIFLSIFYGLLLTFSYSSVFDIFLGDIIDVYANGQQHEPEEQTDANLPILQKYGVQPNYEGLVHQRSPEPPFATVLPQRVPEILIETPSQEYSSEYIKPEHQQQREPETQPEAPPQGFPPAIPICKDNEILIGEECIKIR